MSRSAPELEVLLVEDEPADRLLLQQGLRELGLPWKLENASCGVQAIARMEDSEREPAQLVLLDLNLPGMSGLEILQRIRGNQRWRGVPVVMLTSSRRRSDIRACYAAGANTYVIKSSKFKEMLGNLRLLHEYWTGLAELDPPLEAC